jgi:hypothetical protein
VKRRLFLASLGLAATEPYVLRAYSFLWAPVLVPGCYRFISKPNEIVFDSPDGRLFLKPGSFEFTNPNYRLISGDGLHVERLSWC